MVDHGLQAGLRPRWPREPSRSSAASVCDAHSRRASTSDATAVPRPRHAPSALRGARAAPPPTPSCSRTPWTTRPRPSCWASVAARDPGRSPACGPATACGGAPSSACAGPTPSRSAGPTGLDWWTDPHNSDPAYRRVAAADRGHAAARGRPGQGSGRGAGSHRRPRCAPTARTSTPSPRLSTTRSTCRRWPRCRRRCALGCCAATPSPRAPTRRRCSAHHIDELDRLVTNWRGQRRVELPGGVERDPDGAFVVASFPPLWEADPVDQTHVEGDLELDQTLFTEEQILDSAQGDGSPDRGGLRGQGPLARRRAEGRGHGHGRPRPQPGPARRDGLDGGVVLRLGHQVVRRRADPQGPRHRPQRAATC